MTENPKTIKLFHLVGNLHQALFRASDKSLGLSAGISSTQSAVLMYLRENMNASMGDVAAAVGIRLTSASGLIDRMMSKGLLTRSRSKNDARTVVLSLTDKGIQLAEAVLPEVKHMNAAMLAAGGSAKEIEIFRTVCERLIAASDSLDITTEKPFSSDKGIGNEIKMKKGAA